MDAVSLGVRQRVVAMLTELQWSGWVWTDYACCPQCGAIYEGIEPSKDGKDQGNPPQTHEPDFALIAMIKELEAA